MEHGFETAWNYVSGVVSTAIGVIKGIITPYIQWNEAIFDTLWAAVTATFKTAWAAIKAVVSARVRGQDGTGLVHGLASLFSGWFSAAASAVGTGRQPAHLRESHPRQDRQRASQPSAPLYNAGVHAIQSLINGITSMIGAVGSAVASIGSKIAGFFGLSPAKEGPLAGKGAPEIRGQHLAQALAAGMMAGHAAVAQAAQHLAGAAGMGAGPVTVPVLASGSGGSGGQRTASLGGGVSMADVVARLDKLIATTAAVPAGVGAHVGGAIGGAAQAASFSPQYPRGGA